MKAQQSLPGDHKKPRPLESMLITARFAAKELQILKELTCGDGRRIGKVIGQILMSISTKKGDSGYRTPFYSSRFGGDQMEAR